MACSARSVTDESVEAPRTRCAWAGSDPLMVAYHDQEWGTPLHDDRRLFEFLILEGAQAGLSWSTILNKREGYRQAFRDFDPVAVAGFDTADIERLLTLPTIVRNRRKVEAAIQNARAYLQTVQELGNFDRYVWAFVGGQPRHNAWSEFGEVPAQTEESQAMSADLRRRGFSFVGPTICYAFMQATGMVNDHLIDCFRYRELTE